jgi:hypothetical protein
MQMEMVRLLPLDGQLNSRRRRLTMRAGIKRERLLDPSVHMSYVLEATIALTKSLFLVGRTIPSPSPSMTRYYCCKTLVTLSNNSYLPEYK